MTWICRHGVEVSARLQYVLLRIEVITLAAFAVIAMVRVYSGDAPDGALVPSLDRLWPGGLGLSQVVDAVVIGVFGQR